MNVLRLQKPAVAAADHQRIAVGLVIDHVVFVGEAGGKMRLQKRKNEIFRPDNGGQYTAALH